jgi:hypothetical protein
MILPGRRLKEVTQKRYRVLLVDDDPLFLTGIPKDLESGGYEVDTAADGETATPWGIEKYLWKRAGLTPTSTCCPACGAAGRSI